MSPTHKTIHYQEEAVPYQLYDALRFLSKSNVTLIYAPSIDAKT